MSTWPWLSRCLQIGEKQLFGPEIIDDAEQMVQAVRENLRIAQSRQKSYADGKRRDLTFSVGDYVYLKESADLMSKGS